jgi:hypothetical protein
MVVVEKRFGLQLEQCGHGKSFPHTESDSTMIQLVMVWLFAPDNSCSISGYRLVGGLKPNILPSDVIHFVVAALNLM